MKNEKAIFILIVLDLMVFFSLIPMINTNNIFIIIEILLGIGIIPLLNSFISKLTKIFISNNSELIQSNDKLRNDMALNIKILIDENKNMKENIEIKFDEFKNEQNLICENISKSQQKIIECIDNFVIANKGINNDVQILLNKENEIIDNIIKNNNILEIKYKELNEFFIKYCNDLKNQLNIDNKETEKLLEEKISKIVNIIEFYKEISEKLFNQYIEESSKNFRDLNQIMENKIDEMKNNLNEKNEKTQKNLESIEILFDDTINNFKEEITEIIKEYDSDLNKNINNMNKKLIDINRNLRDTNEDYLEKSNKNIENINNSINKQIEMHKEFLYKLDENQKNMLRLNKDDIVLMKELIK